MQAAAAAPIEATAAVQYASSCLWASNWFKNRVLSHANPRRRDRVCAARIRAGVQALNSAPFYKVARLAGLAWLAILLRIDAVISPSGTGLIYLTSASRVA
ncbi:MAG: hypothetical protein ACLP0J_05360, partial [Solirubrobacteraceae bacterium]